MEGRKVDLIVERAVHALPLAVRQSLRSFDPRPDRYRGPLADAMRAAMRSIRAGSTTEDEVLDGFESCIASIDFDREFGQWLVDWPPDGIIERWLCRGRRWGGTSTLNMGLNLIYLKPGSSEPPHFHHMLASIQCVLRGRVRYRTYDRVGRFAPDVVALRPHAEFVHARGGSNRVTERTLNAHWFCAEDEPAVLLDLFVGGTALVTDPFEIDDARPFGRQYIDPTGRPDIDGVVAAPELSKDNAYAQFAGRSLSSFPWYA